MEQKLATAEKRVLVDLVKVVQKRGMEGENGGWKEFLNTYDRKYGSSLSDPSKRSNVVLAAFLMSFKKEEDLKFFARFMHCDANRELVEKFKQETPDKETPEQRLVRLTLEHPEYPLDYTFPLHSQGWFVTKPGKKSKMMKSTRMVAVDCEMVLCEDGTEAAARVALVDRELKVKLDTLVNPNKPVADFRTDVTGLSAADIEKTTLTLVDIQKKIRRFLSTGTIIVGHSLNNDLRVLKIDHARVIDTSLIYKYFGTRKHRRPSLNNLCKSVLGYELRKDGATHDCVHDAKAAMQLVLAVIDRGVDTTITKTEADLETEMTRLLLHRIPHDVSSKELCRVISGDFTLEVKLAKKQGGYYRAIANFKTPEEANLAFENIEGNPEMDSYGLPQKLVVFKLSSGSDVSLYVRKMFQDDSHGQISAKKRNHPDDENTNDCKKQKADENKTEASVAADLDRCIGYNLDTPRKSKTKEKTEEKKIVNGNHCEEHLKEIKGLKQTLKEKDYQLQAQDKMISVLKEKLENKKKGR